jgi:thymidylate synthase (FAD)
MNLEGAIESLVTVPVLDGGFVGLIETMPSTWPFGNPIEGATPGDMAIVNAARVSYNGASKGLEADRKLIRYLIKHGHTSPLEMVEMKFLVKAPVVVWWQWVRHRMQELNFQSGRYCAYEEEAYMPSNLRLQDKKNKQASSAQTIGDLPTILLNGLSEELSGTEAETRLLAALDRHYCQGFALYEQLLAAGVAREQARLALPGFALYHTAYVKMNAHALMNFIDKRNHPDAQYEIRQYAAVLEGYFAQVLPWCYEAWRNPS